MAQKCKAMTTNEGFFCLKGKKMHIFKNMEDKNVESSKAMTFCDTTSKALSLTMRSREYIARPKLFPLLSTK